MTRADRSRGMPDYVPRSLWAKRDDPVEQTSTARRLALDDRKERFDQINRLARAAGDAWLVSVAGDFEVWVEVLPTSTFPDELRDKGYRLRDEGQGERILAHAITERFGRGADGALVSITAESTMPVVHRVTHAGIVRVERWSFEL